MGYSEKTCWKCGTVASVQSEWHMGLTSQVPKTHLSILLVLPQKNHFYFRDNLLNRPIALKRVT
ncbi:unnamed protein product [Periconia digitata]|uniref:Uncharacterized protein n=1 Tax=Periconia digitata TaxID=1303443 RepID=A0A9W4U534_9PLEO|nr:unnamed protein product [Periconia digitata]